jgi:hypothetical protein
VNTAWTPSAARAAAVSTRRSRPCAMELRTKAAWSTPGTADIVDESPGAAQQLVILEPHDAAAEKSRC